MLGRPHHMLVLKLKYLLATQAKAEEQRLAGRQGKQGPFIPVLRLRQICTHYSLLPDELKLMLSSNNSSSSSGDNEAAQDGSVLSCADALKRIQAQDAPSTKMKRVLRIIEVIP